jgi:hypothetical protein
MRDWSQEIGQRQLLSPIEPTQRRSPISALRSPLREAAILAKAMPVRRVTKDRTETSIGGAQKDTVREWAGKAANMQPVMWAGLVMMTLVADLLAYFGWWTKAAVAAAVGLGMIVVAETLPDHGTLVLLGGLGVFGVVFLLILYAYYKGQLDRNQNGILDILEKRPEVTHG